jgi:hypothetical protein
MAGLYKLEISLVSKKMFSRQIQNARIRILINEAIVLSQNERADQEENSAAEAISVLRNNSFTLTHILKIEYSSNLEIQMCIDKLEEQEFEGYI